MNINCQPPLQFVYFSTDTHIPWISHNTLRDRLFKNGVAIRKKVYCSGVYVAKSRVLPDNDGIFNVTVLNTSDSDVKLKSGRKVGKLVSSFDTIAGIQFEKGENQMKDIKNITIGDHLSGEERNKLATLLEEYEDVFARNPKKPKTVT